MTSITPELLKELNLARTNPAKYVEKLKAHEARFINDYVYVRREGVKIKTYEGVAGLPFSRC